MPPALEPATPARACLARLRRFGLRHEDAVESGSGESADLQISRGSNCIEASIVRITTAPNARAPEPALISINVPKRISATVSITTKTSSIDSGQCVQ